MSEDEINILIADDDEMLQAILKKEISDQFSDEKIIFRSLNRGALATQTCGIEADIAIVDYHLDGKFSDVHNGIDVVDLIKEQSPDTDVILLSNESDTEIVKLALEHGALEYVPKNEFMLKKLQLAILQCLRIRELKLDLKRQKLRGQVAMFLVGLLIIFGAFLHLKKNGLF